jgi:uncharacterized protein YcbK (DUF882 family)
MWKEAWWGKLKEKMLRLFALFSLSTGMVMVGCTMAASHRLLDTDEPYQLLSGYRSAKTNAMLRRQSRLVAKKSLHISGQAADLRLSSRSVRQLSKAANSCKAGGVGRYSRSNFVHVDCGPLRSWGR